MNKSIFYYYRGFYSLSLLKKTFRLAFGSLTENKSLTALFLVQIIFLFLLAPNWIKISYMIFVFIQLFLVYFKLYLLTNQEL